MCITGGYSSGIKGEQLITVGDNAESDVSEKAAVTVGMELVEKIGQLRKSVAGARQEIIASVVWIGSEQINVAQLVLDTVALVKQLADQLASHTHPSTGQPTNSAAIGQSATQATALAEKYSPVIS
ncbi:hypothetical protein ACIP6T_18040 [Pantoea sp. NPDC088449]|uniref:hypothetical protein n=1 Tax=Pantoea sp. NPDC088449 TaxID=3364392 RepID=UPI00382E0B20